MILLQFTTYGANGTGKKFRQRPVKVHTFTLITLETFFNTNNAYVQILLVFNLLVLHEGNT